MRQAFREHGRTKLQVMTVTMIPGEFLHIERGSSLEAACTRPLATFTRTNPVAFA
jgi:hypothetical protein